MHVHRQIPAILLGTWLVAACSSSQSTSKKSHDGGPNGDATASGGSANSGGGSSVGGTTSTGGGTSGGGKSAGGASGGGRPSSGGGSNDGAVGGSSGSGGSSGTGGRSGGKTDAGGPCGEIALCCPTAGIFRPSCETMVASGVPQQCAAVRGLYCGADGGPHSGPGGGPACTALNACCSTLTAANRTQCDQIVSIGIESTCTQIRLAYCPCIWCRRMLRAGASTSTQSPSVPDRAALPPARLADCEREPLRARPGTPRRSRGA
jgi:hypothetical protein